MMNKLITGLIFLILRILNTTGKTKEKLIKSYMLDDIYVKTDEGWSLAGYIHQTRPFDVYELRTAGGLHLMCADHHLVFDEHMNAIKVSELSPGTLIQTEFGLDPVKYVKYAYNSINMCDMTIFNTNESYYTNHILSHNTTTSALYLLHYACFNVDKNILVLGNKRKTAIEILDKIKKIYLELPFYLKPGIYKWNESEIVFDNGCRIMAEATTINSGIGFTFHCVLADEFAHVPPNILDSFYNNLFPTITAGKAKFIITSTQNGYNLFYRLYKAAEAGENDYKPFKTDWWEVPEWDPDNKCWVKRDEEWHQRQVANYGSEEAFNKQFGTNFDVSANTLISQKIIQKRSTQIKEFIVKELPGVPFADCYYWDPDYEPVTSLRNNYIICTSDLSEGVGLDRTAIPIARMINPGSDDLEVIGYLLTSNLKRDQIALSIQTLMCLYMNLDTSLLSFEYNTYGELFLQFLFENTEKIQHLASFDRSVIIKYYNDDLTKWRYGIKITSANKKTGCMLFKESYERGEIIFNDVKFLSELTNFCDTGGGKYAATYGHDDLMMATIQLEFVKQTTQYKLLRNEFNETGNRLPKDEYGLDDFYNQLNQSKSLEFTNNYTQYPGGQKITSDNIFDVESEMSTYDRLNKYSIHG